MTCKDNNYLKKEEKENNFDQKTKYLNHSF